METSASQDAGAGFSGRHIGDKQGLINTVDVEAVADAKKRIGETRSTYSNIEDKQLVGTPLYSVIGANAGSFTSRMRALSQLPRELSAQGIDALCVFVRDTTLPAGLSRIQTNALKNDILNYLRHASTSREVVTDLLLKLFNDGGQDEVMRDYALQNMTSWYKSSGSDPRIVEMLMRATSLTNGSFAGTALLGLYRLSNESGLDSKTIGKLALSIAAKPEYALPSKISAMEVCGSLGMEKIVPVAASCLVNSDSIPLRLAAISALGCFHSDSALIALQKVQSGDVQILSEAATAVLNKKRGSQ